MAQNNELSRAHKGIYLLPNLFTTGALFAGFYAVIAALKGEFEAAAIAVLIAALLDGLDGRVARLTNTQTEFGTQYDSLSDMMSFGIAPSLVAYAWGLAVLGERGPVWGKIGWLAAFLYAACAALRLARFNAQAQVADKRYFQGLASPAAAALVVSMVWAAHDWGLSGAEMSLPALAVTVGAALLMVSNVRYLSFKSWPLGDRVPFARVLGLLLALVLLAVDPPTMLLAITSGYVASGPALTLWQLRRHRGRRGLARGEPPADSDQ